MSSNKIDTITELSYTDSGVDIEAGNKFVEAIKPIVKSTARTGSNPNIGGFGGLFDLAATQFRDPVLVAATDGVGTKLRIAIDSGIYDTVGIDLVAMCVNDLIVQGAEPLFFLDYMATGKLDREYATSIIAGIANGCRQAGAALIGGETAEMPGIYTGQDFDLAGFSVGAVERQSILPAENIAAGDVLIGLSSTGLHSNGFSLVREVVRRKKLGWSEPAPFQPDTTLGKALLEPTRIYVQPVLEAIRTIGGIKGMAHVTGGGLTENIPRILPTRISAEIDLSALSPQAVFGWLKTKGGIKEAEMLRTFNCGIGMVLIVACEHVDKVSNMFAANGEVVTRLGKLVENGKAPVIFLGKVAW